MHRAIPAIFAVCLLAACDNKPSAPPTPAMPVIPSGKFGGNVVPDVDNPALQPTQSEAARKIEQQCIKDDELPDAQCGCYAKALEAAMGPGGTAYFLAETEAATQAALNAMGANEVMRLFREMDNAKTACAKPG